MEMQEKNVKTQIKRLAKENQIEAARIMAKVSYMELFWTKKVFQRSQYVNANLEPVRLHKTFVTLATIIGKNRTLYEPESTLRGHIR